MLTFARLALSAEQNFFRVSYGRCFSGKIEVPSPPKKPLTAFLLFCKDTRQSLFKNQTMSAPQQTRILAEKWGNLSAASRKTYEDIARSDTIEYGEVHKEYFENLSDEQRQELSRQKSLKRESRKLFRLKKALKESGLPKAPSSSYAIYLQSQAKEKPFTTIAQFSKEVGSKWRTLSEEERKPYGDLAIQAKEAYEEQMIKWRKKLIKSGDTDLLNAYDTSQQKPKKIKQESKDSKPPKKDVTDMVTKDKK